MEITRVSVEGLTELTVSGRIDGYWADHLDSSLAEIVREGQHRVRLELSRATFISSAGIGVMMKYYKQLTRLSGTLSVSSPSDSVRLVLEMTRVAPLLVESAAPAAAARPMAGEGRRIERDGTTFEVFDLTPGATLTLQAIGRPNPGGPAADAAIPCPCPPTRFAFGVGAFGDNAGDCCGRFGELLAVAGAAIYQPGDGTNVPDFLVGEDDNPPQPRLLYGLACDGPFAALARFDRISGPGAIGLARLAEAALALANARAAGLVIVADTAGLVGAALRRAAAVSDGAGDLFVYPAVRDHLTFTAERAFARTLALCVGVVAAADADLDRSQLRPLGRGTDVWGHFHAAAFSFRPFQKGAIDLRETVAGLFETETLLGVLHLLHDDRGASGAGESEFIRGACWFSPIVAHS
jgi:anti-anti-sigma factor